jgi:putative transposase
MSDKNYKEFAPGTIVHIYNRGNNKEKIFFDEQDYKAFLFRIALALGFKQEELEKEKLLSMPYSRIRIESSGKNNFKLHAFCLESNHFHLIMEQCGDESLSKFMSKICISHSMYINKKYKRVGHLFQGNFKSNTIENDPQLMWTSAYIHMNPVKDKMVNSPEQYNWSSYKDYVEERNLPIITRDLLLGIFGDKNSLKKETLNYFKKEDIKDSNFMSSLALDMF